jgi:aryl-alcohol dehydrogenase-like predicted oxidoreductase
MRMAEFDRAPGGAISRRHFLAAATALATGATLYGGDARAAAGPLMTRPVPRTGERLPVIGLGTAIVFDIGEDAARRAERSLVIAALVENGARVIDTAPSYGTAESVAGDLVAALGVRDRVFLATKVRAAPRDAAAAEMQASLRRLRSNRLDLMQIHNPGADLAAAADQLALLREWKERGVFRYLGVTHFQEAANERLIALMEREKLDFVQVNYSMAERSAEARLLPAAAATGTAVLVNLPFARAKLFSAVRGKQVPEWAAEFDATSWGQFFLKYVLAHEAVTCVIPGMDKPEYVLDNLNAARGRLPDAAMRAKMTGFLDSLR